MSILQSFPDSIMSSRKLELVFQLFFHCKPLVTPRFAADLFEPETRFELASRFLPPDCILESKSMYTSAASPSIKVARGILYGLLFISSIVLILSLTGVNVIGVSLLPSCSLFLSSCSESSPRLLLPSLTSHLPPFQSESSSSPS